MKQINKHMNNFSNDSRLIKSKTILMMIIGIHIWSYKYVAKFLLVFFIIFFLPLVNTVENLFTLCFSFGIRVSFLAQNFVVVVNTHIYGWRICVCVCMWYIQNTQCMHVYVCVVKCLPLKKSSLSYGHHHHHHHHRQAKFLACNQIDE